MAVTLNSFTSETQLPTTELSLVSSSSSETKFLGSIYMFNTSASNVEVTLWLNQSATTGTTGSGSNVAFVGTIPSQSGKKITLLGSQVVGASMKLSGKASVASVVNAFISGTTET